MTESLAALLHIDCPCGGIGKCGKCRIKADGKLSEPTEAERRLLGDLIDKGWRLACQTYPLGDFHADTSGDSELRSGKGSGELVVDIGTTTIEVRLIAQDGNIEAFALNPQRRFGADVISRIGAADSHASELTNELRDALSRLTEGFQYDRAVVTGNTVMLHFLTGLDVSGLAGYPFSPSSLFGMWIDGETVGLHGRVYLPRCVSAFVGADTVCALIKTAPKPDETTLLVDLGTNGELAFCAGKKIVCASTAAGPALEGADISSGMRAGEGAIDRVGYFPGNDPEIALQPGAIICADGILLPHVIGGGAAKGICGSGLISLIAALLDAGIIDDSGYLVAPFEIAPGVSLTPQDVRAFQLAKSAIRTGISLICDDGGIDRLCIAGNFGKGLDFAACRRTGLLPDCKRLDILGNAALSGAEMLLSGADDNFVLEWKDLAADEQFNELFTENLMFGKDETK